MERRGDGWHGWKAGESEQSSRDGALGENAGGRARKDLSLVGTGRHVKVSAINSS